MLSVFRRYFQDESSMSSSRLKSFFGSSRKKGARVVKRPPHFAQPVQFEEGEDEFDDDDDFDDEDYDENEVFNDESVAIQEGNVKFQDPGATTSKPPQNDSQSTAVTPTNTNETSNQTTTVVVTSSLNNNVTNQSDSTTVPLTYTGSSLSSDSASQTGSNQMVIQQ